MVKLNCAFCNYSSQDRKDLDSHFTEVHERQIILNEEGPPKKILKSTVEEHNRQNAEESHQNLELSDIKPKFSESVSGHPIMTYNGFEYRVEKRREMKSKSLTIKHLTWCCRLRRIIDCKARANQINDDITFKGEHCHKRTVFASKSIKTGKANNEEVEEAEQDKTYDNNKVDEYNKSDEEEPQQTSENVENNPSGKPQYSYTRKGTKVMEFNGYKYLQKIFYTSGSVNENQIWRCILNRTLSCRARAYQNNDEIIVKGDHSHKPNMKARFARHLIQKESEITTNEESSTETSITREVDDSEIQATEEDMIKDVVEEYFTKNGTKEQHSKAEKANTLKMEQVQMMEADRKTLLGESHVCKVCGDAFLEEKSLDMHVVEVHIIGPKKNKSCLSGKYEVKSRSGKEPKQGDTSTIPPLENKSKANGSINALLVKPDTLNCKIYEGKIITQPQIHEPNDEVVQREVQQNQKGENQTPEMECKYCQFTSTNNMLLKLHEKDHIKIPGMVQQAKGNLSVKEMQCEYCPYSTYNMTLLRQHGKGHIKQIVAQVSDEVVQREPLNHENQLECKYCPYTTFKAELLNEHEKGHIKQYGIASTDLTGVLSRSPEKGKVRKGNLGCDTCDYTSMDLVCLASHFE